MTKSLDSEIDDLYRRRPDEFTQARKELASGLKGEEARLVKQLKKALNHLITNPSHPGLQSHPMGQFDKIFGGKVFSSYVQNHTPQAHRILWLYGPKPKQISIVAVIPHY